MNVMVHQLTMITVSATSSPCPIKGAWDTLFGLLKGGPFGDLMGIRTFGSIPTFAIVQDKEPTQGFLRCPTVIAVIDIVAVIIVAVVIIVGCRGAQGGESSFFIRRGRIWGKRIATNGRGGTAAHSFLPSFLRSLVRSFFAVLPGDGLLPMTPMLFLSFVSSVSLLGVCVCVCMCTCVCVAEPGKDLAPSESVSRRCGTVPVGQRPTIARYGSPYIHLPLYTYVP